MESLEHFGLGDRQKLSVLKLQAKMKMLEYLLPALHFSVWERMESGDSSTVNSAIQLRSSLTKWRPFWCVYVFRFDY